MKNRIASPALMPRLRSPSRCQKVKGRDCRLRMRLASHAASISSARIWNPHIGQKLVPVLERRNMLSPSAKPDSHEPSAIGTSLMFQLSCGDGSVIHVRAMRHEPNLVSYLLGEKGLLAENSFLEGRWPSSLATRCSSTWSSP